jgi:hypothetical protein
MNIELRLNNAPGWASGRSGGGRPPTPSHLTEHADFLKMLSETVRSGVDAYSRETNVVRPRTQGLDHGVRLEHLRRLQRLAANGATEVTQADYLTRAFDYHRRYLSDDVERISWYHVRDAGTDWSIRDQNEGVVAQRLLAEARLLKAKILSDLRHDREADAGFAAAAARSSRDWRVWADWATVLLRRLELPAANIAAAHARSLIPHEPVTALLLDASAR